MNRLLGSTDGNWIVPALVVVCRNTHKWARASGQLHAAVQLLQDSYSKTFCDRKEVTVRPTRKPLAQRSPQKTNVSEKSNTVFDSNGSKKVAVLPIVNQLCAMYFRLNILRLCKNLTRPVELKGLHKLAHRGDQVTYRYYTGRLALYEDNHEMAESHLDYALRNCPKQARRNKKRILQYLVPVRLYRGRLPVKACTLTSFSLLPFSVAEKTQQFYMQCYVTTVWKNLSPWLKVCEKET